MGFLSRGTSSLGNTWENMLLLKMMVVAVAALSKRIENLDGPTWVHLALLPACC